MQHTEIENHLSEEGYSCHYIKGKDQLSGVCASMPRLVVHGKQEKNRNISSTHVCAKRVTFISRK